MLCGAPKGGSKQAGLKHEKGFSHTQIFPRMGWVDLESIELPGP